MDQIGRILKVENDIATLELERNSACDKCGICHMGETKKMILTAVNSIDAKVGQRVLISMEKKSVLKAGLVVYMIPLLALLGGIGLTYLFANMLDYDAGPDMIALGVGLAFFGLSFVVIRKLEPLWQKDPSYNPEIVKVVEDFEEVTDYCGHNNE